MTTEADIVHYLKPAKPGLEGFSSATSLHRVMLNGFGPSAKEKAGLQIVNEQYDIGLKELIQHPEVLPSVKKAALSKLVNGLLPNYGNEQGQLVSIFLNPLGVVGGSEIAFKRMVQFYSKNLEYPILLQIQAGKIYMAKGQTENKDLGQEEKVGAAYIGEPPEKEAFVVVKIDENLRSFVAQKIDETVVAIMKKAAKEYRWAEGDSSKEGSAMRVLKAIENNGSIKPELRNEAKRLYEQISTLTVKGLDVKIAYTLNMYKPHKWVQRGIHAVKKAQVRVQPNLVK